MIVLQGVLLQKVLEMFMEIERCILKNQTKLQSQKSDKAANRFAELSSLSPCQRYSGVKA